VLSAQIGKKVLLIDADTNLANIDILLGISPLYNISHVIAGLKEAREILVEGPNEIAILPAASGNIEQALNEGVASESVIADLNSLEENFELVILDTGAGVSRTVLDFILFSDTMVLITTPEPTAITDAYAIAKLIASERVDIDIQILVNFARHKSEASEVYEKLSSVMRHFLKVEAHFLGYLPVDPYIGEAVHLQKPFIQVYPKSPASQQIKFITRKLLHLPSAGDHKKFNLFDKLLRRPVLK
jgi:flagellar biosynthesis protein FlhG